MPTAESSPVQEDAGGTPEAAGAGSRQAVLMYGPAAHLVHLVSYCMDDWLSLEWADFAGRFSAWKLAGFFPHSSLQWRAGREVGKGCVASSSTAQPFWGPSGCMWGAPQVSNEGNRLCSGTGRK